MQVLTGILAAVHRRDAARSVTPKQPQRCHPVERPQEFSGLDPHALVIIFVGLQNRDKDISCVILPHPHL